MLNLNGNETVKCMLFSQSGNRLWHGMQVVRHSWVSEGMADGLGTTFFLDGAHTPESMATCAEWFFEASHTQLDTAEQAELAPHRILLFNCMKVTSL